MIAVNWKQKLIDHAQLGRELRDAVSRTYLVPAHHEGKPISTGIAIRLEDMAKIVVMATHSGGAFNHTIPSPINTVNELDVATLEALARTKREVERWARGDRDDIPTAKELDLIDASQHGGVPEREMTPTEPRPIQHHTVNDETRLPPKQAPQ